MNPIINHTNLDVSTIPFKKALMLTEKAISKKIEATLLLVSKDEMFNLNNQLRGKTSPTDILSLPLDTDSGEIYICPDYIFSQGFTNNRIIHLWIHGLLHLAGYTHDNDDDFAIMSDLEINLCAKLGISNPYMH